MYARGAWNKLGRLTGINYLNLPEAILPNDVIDSFSWRMICEMVEAAADQAEKTPTDTAAIIAAAHKYLEEKQYEIARIHLDRLMGADAPRELDAITMSEVLSTWFAENWNLIPEVAL